MRDSHDIETEFSANVAAYEAVAAFAIVGISAFVALAVIMAGHFGAVGLM